MGFSDAKGDYVMTALSAEDLETHNSTVKDAPGMGYGTTRGTEDYHLAKQGGRLPTKLEGSSAQYFTAGMYGELKRNFYQVCQYFDSWSLFRDGAAELVKVSRNDVDIKVPKYLIEYDSAFYQGEQDPGGSSETGYMPRSPANLPFGEVPNYLAKAAFDGGNLGAIDLFHHNSQLTLAQVEEAFAGDHFPSAEDDRDSFWVKRWRQAEEGTTKGVTKQTVVFELELAYRLTQLVTSMAPRLRETPKVAGLCDKVCKDVAEHFAFGSDQLDSKQDWGTLPTWNDSVEPLSENYFSYFAGDASAGKSADTESAKARRTRISGQKVWDVYQTQKSAKTWAQGADEFGVGDIIEQWRVEAKRVVSFLNDPKNIPVATSFVGQVFAWPAWRNREDYDYWENLTYGGPMWGGGLAAGYSKDNFRRRHQAVRQTAWQIYVTTGFNVMLWPKKYVARNGMYDIGGVFTDGTEEDPLNPGIDIGLNEGPGILGPFFSVLSGETATYTGVGAPYGADNDDWFSNSDPRVPTGASKGNVWKIPTVDQLLYDRVVYHTIWVPRRRWAFHANYSFPQPKTYYQPFDLAYPSRKPKHPDEATLSMGTWTALLQGAESIFSLPTGPGIQTKDSTSGEDGSSKIRNSTTSSELDTEAVTIPSGWVTSVPSRPSAVGLHGNSKGKATSYPWGSMFWNRDLQIYWQHESGPDMSSTIQPTDGDWVALDEMGIGVKKWWKKRALYQADRIAMSKEIGTWRSVMGPPRARGGLRDPESLVAETPYKFSVEGVTIVQMPFVDDAYGHTTEDFGHLYILFVLGTINKRISELCRSLGLYSLSEATDAVGEGQGAKYELGQGKDQKEDPEMKIPTPAAKIREAVTIWDQQCFLMENIRVLSYAAGRRRYPNFGLLKGKPGNLVSRLNHAAMSTSAVRTLLDITPDVYAFLTPYIKLTRVRYDPDDVTKVIGEDPLPFESYTSREDIDKILTSRAGRQSGAGIKSFQWSLKGVQPAEVDNNITATLVVHFQSLYDLFKYNVVSSTGDAQAGIVDPQAENQMAGFLDLIMAPETVSKASDKAPETDNSKEAPCDIGSKIYEGCYYRIKAEVGWSIPSGMENHPGISDPESLRQALEYQRKVLFLQIARHEIDFKQDGSLTLTVTYQAALDGMLKSTRANIFASETLFAKGGPIEELKKAREDVELERGRNNGEIDYENSGAYKKYEELLEEVEALERQDKMIKYQQVLKQIFEVSPEVGGTRIYSIRVGMSDLIQRGNWGDMTPAQRKKQAEQRQKDPGFKKITSSGNPEPALVEAIEKAPTGTKQGFLDALTEVGTTIDSIRGATPRDMVDIHYFYFGDLIYSVLQLDHIKTFIEAKNFQIILGTIELIDPLVAYQFRDFSDAVRCNTLRSATASRELARLRPYQSTESTGVFEHFDIANIPISVDAFSEWFLQNVIKPGRDSYYLLHFIKDVLASLVSAALNPSCFTGLPATPTRFATSDILLKGTAIAAGQIWTADSIVGARPSESKVQPRNSQFSLKSHENKPPIPTFFIYSTDSRPQGYPDAAGNPPFEEDLEQGIYHFYLGSAAGLVKRINFTRADQPYLREAKIQRYGTLGTEQLRELYNVQMSMIGNTLLKNGQYIYVNPVAIGAGNPGAVGSAANLARKIGLGGYFLVTGVDHTISDAGFEVQVTALHQAMRKNAAQTIDVSPPPVEEGTSPEEAPADSGEGSAPVVDVDVEITKAPARRRRRRRREPIVFEGGSTIVARSEGEQQQEAALEGAYGQWLADQADDRYEDPDDEGDELGFPGDPLDRLLDFDMDGDGIPDSIDDHVEDLYSPEQPLIIKPGGN